MNEDEEALKIYQNWGVCEEIVKEVKTHTLMIPLISSKELNLSYQINGKTLEVSGYFDIRCKMSRLYNLIIVPDCRQEWDLRLKSMHECENGYKMSYFSDHKTFTFTTTLEVTENPTFFEATFTGTLENDPSSQIKFFYTVEKISGNDFEESEKVRCSWNYEFKGRASKIIMYDIIGEDNLLQNSFFMLIQCCPDNYYSVNCRPKRVSICEAAARKLLDSSPKSFAN